MRLFPWQPEAETEGLEADGTFLFVVEGIVICGVREWWWHGCVRMMIERVGGVKGDSRRRRRGFALEKALEG